MQAQRYPRHRQESRPRSFRIRWSGTKVHKSTASSPAPTTAASSTPSSRCSARSRATNPSPTSTKSQQPSAPIRWVNDWDNLDGTIERGYGGRSIFFENGHVRADLSRVNDYARLLASVGINGCAINNVNAEPRVLKPDFSRNSSASPTSSAPGASHSPSPSMSAAQNASAASTHSILSIPASPKWWQQRLRRNLRKNPRLRRLRRQSRFRRPSRPFDLHRSPADAANVIARALKPHGGIVFYRAFVYNHHLDWRNPKNDRATRRLRQFPSARRPVRRQRHHPDQTRPDRFPGARAGLAAFRGLEQTNEAIELQITQEYTGQQRHMCFPRADVERSARLRHARRRRRRNTPVKDLVAGKIFHRPIGGFVGIANVGLDANWLAHPLAMANLYGFGRLAWDPDLTPREIADEWTQLTFGDDPTVVQTITAMQLSSWRTYENYTGPLGAQTLTDITRQPLRPRNRIVRRKRLGPVASRRRPRHRHGPHRRDRHRLRGQYRPPVAKIYESLATTPDELRPCSSTTFHTPTISIPAKPSSSTFTIPTTTAPTKSPASSINGNRCKAKSTRTFQRRPRAPRIPSRSRHRLA